MRWFAVILLCAVLASTYAEPDPKKYKPDVKDKDKPTNTSLTDDERKFLREVEAKFGIKSDVPLENKKDVKLENSNATLTKAPFPAVIAIEIVNDTETNTKGKRTIDANLGYGYRTNNGYTYTYFGKQPQEKGKFMIYPYSQEDIPASRPTYTGDSGQYTTSSPNVEIQPSRAYELIDVKEEQNGYQYNKPTPTPTTNYENIKGLVSPPPAYSPSESHQETLHSSHPSTLYTTYNGQEFSSLSGQFPMVMSNYLVESSQLVKNPQYQSAGLNQDYLRSHGTPLDQRVVPVLVLRVPSSYLKKPTAELYSNSPKNAPVSQYLNNVNLQELVNNYFKKIGYSFAPQVMTYQSPILMQPISTPSVGPAANYEQQHYSAPYVHQPAYTQADYSGVQYSAVQPVMAKYPTTYHQQYYVPMAQSPYQQPKQQYEYTYQYVPQTQGQPLTYYVQQPQYQTQTEEIVSRDPQQEHAAVNQGSSVANSHAEYVSQQNAGQDSAEQSVEYVTPGEGTPRHAAQFHYESSQTASQEYGQPKEQTAEYVYQNPTQSTVSVEHSNAQVSVSSYNTHQPAQYTYSQQSMPKESLALYHSQLSQTAPKYSLSANTAGTQSYYYQKPSDNASGKTLVLHENYPSQDHTLATVLPLSYKRDRKPSVQTVSYVTPVPYSSKYQSPYKIMVPQTVLKNPATEKVSYVNSHSLPYSQVVGQEYNPEAEYTLPAHYAPPLGKQKPPSYPRNYHSHPKRNAKPEKAESVASQKKSKETNDSTKKSA